MPSNLGVFAPAGRESEVESTPHGQQRERRSDGEERAETAHDWANPRVERCEHGSHSALLWLESSP